jgi:hypothetical protein
MPASCLPSNAPADAGIYVRSLSVGYWSILLQKSFGGDERNFPGSLMRFVRRDVRDLIAYQENGSGPWYRQYCSSGVT